ncbi:TPA: EndoU domain-containing protein [Salmonella enterica]|nr:EndoU domain-containing protein [Salmonella enterica]
MSYEFVSEDGNKFTLNDKAITHIINGDITDKAEPKIGSEKPVASKVIKGGLHTIRGFIDFLQYHPEIRHLIDFDSKIHKAWYYARELQNGVLTLRIPKELFGNKAAKMTMYPDDYYKSGYLWKTFFPDGFGEKEIVEAIRETLNNIDYTESQNGLVVGYANTDDILKTIRITIQHTNGQINSAFPSWTQPNTGNNGKSYSHYDSIGYVISWSSVKFSTDTGNVVLQLCKPDTEQEMFSLLENTPSLFLERSIPKKNNLEWQKKRKLELELLSPQINESEAKSVLDYLHNISAIKYHNLIINSFYNKNSFFLHSNIYFNAIQIHQNICDGLYLILLLDNKNSTNHLNNIIEYLLQNMVSFVGIDSWFKRKIIHEIIQACLLHHDKNILIQLIISLSESPVRREILIDFNLDSIVKKSISVPQVEMPVELMIVYGLNYNFDLKPQHFCEFIKENLGETYAFYFNDLQRGEIYNGFAESGGINYKLMIHDALKYITVDYFDLFPEVFSEIINSLEVDVATDKNRLDTALSSILRDYCRIQFAHRARINLTYKEFKDIELPLIIIDKNQVYGSVLKHERMINSYKLNIFLDKLEHIIEKINAQELPKQISDLRGKIGREIPPIISPIPKRILDKNPSLKTSKKGILDDIWSGD